MNDAEDAGERDARAARGAMDDGRLKLALPMFQVIAGFGLFWLSGWATWWLAVSVTFVVWPVIEYRRNRRMAVVQLVVGGGLCVVLGLMAAPFIAWSVGGFGP